MTLAADSVKPIVLAIAIAVGVFTHCGRADAAETRTAIFAGGCFWCVEADFEKVDGVGDVVSGYTGGTVADPTYKQVSRGGTGHYEAAMIPYDPDRVSYRELVDLFFRSVDPTDAGGQFCDRGESYRTAIFATPEQATVAKEALAAAQTDLGQEIVTPVLPAQPFYPAEAYHQDYYKSGDLILTRFGPRSKAKAYKLYRDACGRDQRVKALWGSSAPFVGG
ncbi:peptide-methionine (S)-S-oxide reductase MsrA [Tropicimonas isoalkanivorans]|uniref:Peptide methionine sulfoxide reductase MsrA n=1 Tax=Tropicimonas isoalkanivorans TaxID=441112 RepID=A0A1I1M6U6_9RHOB|nr:peptide-methionine (S)-S-oxide reductase MsrA [Tropicimonas isoalkanivorans]SFC80502.1 peptide-methionine (S)-S-oxide reductase [Tropicimonas isoalkanivorans]